MTKDELKWRPVKLKAPGQGRWIEAVIINIKPIMLKSYHDIEYIGLTEDNVFSYNTIVIEADPNVAGFDTEEELIDSKIKALEKFSKRWKHEMLKKSFQSKYRGPEDVLYRELLYKEDTSKYNLTKYF